MWNCLENQCSAVSGFFVWCFGLLLWWVQTFVYGDLYRFDVEKQDWKLVSSPNSPPPRSSHQAIAWKNYLYIFGTNTYWLKEFWQFFALSELFSTLQHFLNCFHWLLEQVVSSHLRIRSDFITTRWELLYLLIVVKSYFNLFPAFCRHCSKSLLMEGILFLQNRTFGY